MDMEDSVDLSAEIDLDNLREELSKNGMVLCPFGNCSQSFKSLGALNYHLKQGHHQTSRERSFKCEQCNLSFQSRVNLRKHRAADHSENDNESPLVSPLASPSPKKKETFNFTSTSDKKMQEIKEITDHDNSHREVIPQLNSLGDLSESGSCNKLNKSCSTNQDLLENSKSSSDSVLELRSDAHDSHTNPSRNENNARTITGTAKRKRRQPKKLIISSAQGVTSSLVVGSSCPDRLSELSSSSPAKTKIDSKKAPVIDVTPARRTSSRVRTPRKNFYFEMDTANNGNLPGSTSRKRGRKRKNTAEEKSDDDDDNAQIGASKKQDYKTPKKRRRKPKRVNLTNDDTVSVKNPKGVNVSKKSGRKSAEGKGSVSTGDHVDVKMEDGQQENEDSIDGHSDIQDNNVGDDDDKFDDDDDDDDGDSDDDKYDAGGDGNDIHEDDDGRSCTPPEHTKEKRKNQRDKKELSNQENTSTKQKGRGKKNNANVTEITLLKKYTKFGKKLICRNEGCGAKFRTAAGYVAHKKTCGVREEDREKFPCEICGKEYTTMPGLAYHMKAKHVESETDNNDQQAEAKEDTEEPEVTETGRIRRKAASRAMSKVQQLAADPDMLTSKDRATKNDKPIKKADLDQLITTVPGRQVSSKLEERWSKTLQTESNITCPCKGCLETFSSITSIKDHLKTCEKAVSHKCLACGKVFAVLMVARTHVKYWHVGYSPAGKDRSDSSDVDFQVISSDDSDEGENCVEIEEVDDSGSEVLEDSDELEEVVVWDDTTKKNTRFKRQQKRESQRASRLLVGFIGRTNSPAYMATEKWRKEAHRHDVLFHNLRPTLSYWSIVDSSKIEQYVPEASSSPPFVIRRRDETDGQVSQQLPLFGSTTKRDSPVYGDVTFNVGGPVWAMDWCPVPDSRNNESQFLAISTHRSLDQVHSIHKTISGKGIIQLWDVGKLKVDSASSGSAPTLAFGIAHNYGVIWDLTWCPSGTWECKSATKNQVGGLSRLGVLAVACSDGFVRILSIPWPSELSSSLRVKQSGDPAPYSPVIAHATPHAVLMPCALGVTYDGQCGQAWCIKWIPHSMHEKIATGFSDGTVAIWNLLTESRLLKRPEDDKGLTFRLAPFLHIMTNSSVVRCLAWCPEEPDLLATGSYDRGYKVWNLKTPYTPVAVFRRAQPTEMHWSFVAKTIMSSEDDCFQNVRLPCIVRTFNFTHEKSFSTTYQATTHSSTIWTIHVSDWAKLLACGDAGGEVEAVNLRKKYKAKFGVYRVYLEKREHENKREGQNELPQKQGAHKEGTQTEDNNKGLEGTVGNQDGDISVGSKDTTAKDVKCIPLPRTTEETFQQYELVFHDTNTIEFAENVNRSDPEVKRHFDPSTMQTAPYDNFTNPQAILKVRFNPNIQAFTWLASGGAAGLARLHLVKQVKNT